MQAAWVGRCFEFAEFAASSTAVIVGKQPVEDQLEAHLTITQARACMSGRAGALL
jgi:hypothetical protein